MKKSVISLLLVVAMLMTAVPWAWAQEETPAPEADPALVQAEPEADPEEGPADPAADPEEGPADPAADPAEDPAAPAADPEEDPADSEADPVEDPADSEAQAELPVIGEQYTLTFGDDLFPKSNDALFTAYVKEMFRAGDPDHLSFPQDKRLPDPSELLSPWQYSMEQRLKQHVQSIASGSKSNTKIEIYLPDLGIQYTAINQTGMETVFQVLILDCTYELYWFGRQVAWGLTSEKKMVVLFAVADDYVSDTAETYVKSSAIKAAKAAVKNTAAIITANAGLSDVEKLRAYKDEICRLTEYNYDAAYTDMYLGQEGPWNLVWVFDGDPETNVVCEGYAKAFEYLCNHSTFQSGLVNCYCATGQAVFPGGASGPHMWNIVTLADGRNYVIDVTNCDEGDTGDDSFFLCCAVDGDPQGGYTLSNGSFFGYDKTTQHAVSARYRTLATSPYYGAAGNVSITQHPQKQRVLDGEEATFTVTASGSGLSYQWYKLDIKHFRQGWLTVSGATEPTLTLTALGDMDNTLYYCLVTGSDGRCASECALLQVVVAPVIVAQSEDIIAIEYENPLVSVEATGTYLTFQWYSRSNKDGSWEKKVRTGGTGSNTNYVSSLELWAHPSYRGQQFYCEISNDAGTVSSDIVTLKIIRRPTRPSSDYMRDVFVLPGDVATFHVIVEPNLFLTYQWYRIVDGQQVLIEGATEETYSFVATADMDGDRYRCLVTNPAGSYEAYAYLYIINAPPVITTQPKDYTLKQTGYDYVTGYISLSAEGRSLSYQWYRSDGENEYPIEGATSTSLMISTDDPYLDDNQVWCVVSNPLGSVTSDRATVSIYLRPAVTEQPQDAVVASGETATFSVSGTGKELTYQWYVNDGSGAVAIEGATAWTYSFVAAHEQHGATYYCVLSNPAAAVQSDAALLIVDHVPAAPVQENEVAATCVSNGQYDEVVYCSDCGLELKRTACTTPKNPENHQYKDRRLVETRHSTCVTEGYQKYSITCSRCYKKLGEETVPLPLSTEHTRKNSVNENDIPATAWSRGSVDTVYYCIYCGVELERKTEIRKKHVENVGSWHLTIDQEPEDATADSGTAVLFTVKGYSTSSSPKYQWYSRTAPEEEWTLVKGGARNKLSVKTTANLDGTQYICYVSNKFGTVYSDVVTLTVVIHPPILTLQPEDVTVDNGTAAVFTAAAQGKAVKYQWYCRTQGGDWVKAKGGTKATLKLSKVKAADNGSEYRCKVYNADGSVTSETATLTVVLHPPVVTLQPEDVTVDNGTAAVFTAAAQGKAVKYQWYCRTQGGDWVKAKGGTKATLKLSKVKAADNGVEYRCEAYNADGSVTSETATLTVVLHPPVVTLQPEDVTVDRGTAAVFTAAAEGKAVKYQWYCRTQGGDWVKAKNGTKATLKLSKVKAADNGVEYRCEAYNADGAVTSETATLTVVLHPPVITLQPTDVMVNAGGTAVFTVAAEGKAVKYQWYCQTSPTAARTKVKNGTKATLTLTRVKAESSGWLYTCDVYNEDGTVTTAAAVLTVQ